MTRSSGSERLDFGTVTQAGKSIEVPGDFSTVLTLVINLSYKGQWEGKQPSLDWSLYDTVDGDHWLAVEDTLGDFTGNLAGNTRRTTQTRRFVVPFGPRLFVGVRLRCALTNQPPEEGQFDGVVATVYWRGMGVASERESDSRTSTDG